MLEPTDCVDGRLPKTSVTQAVKAVHGSRDTHHQEALRASPREAGLSSRRSPTVLVLNRLFGNAPLEQFGAPLLSLTTRQHALASREDRKLREAPQSGA